MSPEKWKENFYPATKRAVDHVHSKGKFFFYHSCGKVDQLFGGIVSLGPDVINLLQACNDQPYIKGTFGRDVVLQCGLDTQNCIDIPNPTDEEIRAEVDRTIRVFAPGGNFFAGMYLPGCLPATAWTATPSSRTRWRRSAAIITRTLPIAFTPQPRRNKILREDLL